VWFDDTVVLAWVLASVQIYFLFIALNSFDGCVFDLVAWLGCSVGRTLHYSTTWAACFLALVVVVGVDTDGKLPTIDSRVSLSVACVVPQPCRYAA